MIDRTQQRRLMMMERPRLLCDLCNSRNGEHMHEIITRGMTQGNAVARNLSFNRYLCSWLCPHCHDQAHNGRVARILLERNCNRYGYDRVKKAFDEVEAAAGKPFLMAFPLKEEA